ncbi:N-6 DNA methylase [Streptomyces sp. MST-110588]|uniref:N-6 DNA methylase n=1 Tax=Streptomyces sp. MST-110588 TaxID=2833628 RepID=UPI001F5C46C7|nr:N-6 DNA methylase [Streptomyces sp. MST-110588]
MTLAEIARLAGVGRAAVSNWRRRHPTFPLPVAGTDARPQFSLPEVREWLSAEGRLPEEPQPLDLLWPEYEALGSREAMGALVARIGLRLSGAGPAREEGLPPLNQAASDLLKRTLDTADAQALEGVFEQLLERWLRTHVRQVAATPEPLARLMHTVAVTVRGASVPRSVFDPACGTGMLLLAALGDATDGGSPAVVLGQDNDAVLAALTRARLALATASRTNQPDIRIAWGDSLRSNEFPTAQADMVLSNPPWNERDWGDAELATDARWVYGQPPRTESELAWVQHIISALSPDGVGVVLLPPAVASRRAGRRIRTALLQNGVLRAVVALPPGTTAPFGVGLHVWVLRSATSADSDASDPRVVLVDAARDLPTVPGGGVPWDALTDAVRRALRGEDVAGVVRVPVVELLDGEVDLTPARHVPDDTATTAADLKHGWTGFGRLLGDVSEAFDFLSTLAVSDERDQAWADIGELELADALTLKAGQALPEASLLRGDSPEGGIPVLVGRHFVDVPRLWVPAQLVRQGREDDSLTVTANGDVVVSALARAFDVQVETAAPAVLGPHMVAIRANPALLDPWFLAGCLHSAANARQAGTHSSTSSRVDVRKLRVPRLPLHEQQRLGDVHRRISDFDRHLDDLRASGRELRQALGELLFAGRLSTK